MPSTASRFSIGVGRDPGRWWARAAAASRPPAARMLRLIEPNSRLCRRWHGEDVTGHAEGGKLRDLRRRMQIIFQDPYRQSLNPRMTVGAEIVGEPLLVLMALASGSERTRPRRRPVRRASACRPGHGARATRTSSPAASASASASPAPWRWSPKLIVGDEAGVGARRFDPGAGHQPAAGPAGEHGPRLSLHLARPRRGRAHQPPRRRDVSRPASSRSVRRAARSSVTRSIPIRRS